MIRVDGAYLYEFGEKVRIISRIPDTDISRIDLWVSLYGLTQAIDDFVTKSVFSPGLRTLHNPAQALFKEISELIPDPIPEDFEGWQDIIGAWQIGMLKTKAREFEVVLIAELQSAALYHVLPKGGFDTMSLIERGTDLFPPDLPIKVPEALPDVLAATKCIGFELPTAAGFHLHRVNEAVLRIYWDKVSEGKDRPMPSNMGVYLAAMEKDNLGRKEVRDYLKSIKDFHRNPIMHPDQSIDTIDQAIDLLAAIRSSIGYMLREIS
ncbi:hypothetical protein [Asticcacaulis taihuensis]|uniref:hypothetical protein n=1 Tax=Asticcacaulis taihuensis TaxID=260084 RepID=UPI003F7CBFA1